MKNSILLICLIAFIACKKKDNKTTPNNSAPTGPSQTSYEVYIESNFKRSHVTIENMTDMTIMKRYNNPGDSTKNLPITYSFIGLSTKKYRVYSYSCKSASDTTIYMTDSGLTWNYLRVKKNGTIIYEHKDTIGYGNGYGSHRITSNECLINY